MYHKKAMLLTGAGVAAMLIIQMAAVVAAQDEDPSTTSPPRSAEAAFALYCAPCHGEDGRGNGPLAFAVSKPLPDLTTLTMRNGGSFPRERLARLIDGRDDIKAHTGEREMPAWGEWFKLEGEGLGSMDEEEVRMRIEKLLDLLESMQQENP
ncbi:MAG TPA: c-type cytochrome [Aestuariivirgaceae bacterium]|jgi:mono/diheme cytochrome c family protein